MYFVIEREGAAPAGVRPADTGTKPPRLAADEATKAEGSRRRRTA